MKKIKITIAAVALIATVGITTASFAMDKAEAIDCSEQPFGKGRLIDHTTCIPSGEICCYDLIDNTAYFGTFPE